MDPPRPAGTATNPAKADLKLHQVTSTSIGQVEEFNGTVYSEDQYRKLTRKIDRYLIPIMFFCYGIQQTDKTGISIQAVCLNFPLGTSCLFENLS
jgi:hypothetical protein